MIEEALKLYQRVKDRTDNPSLGKEALQMEAYCHLLLHQPEATLKLLDENQPGSGLPALYGIFDCPTIH